MVAEINWNQEPTAAECADNLLDAIQRRDRANKEAVYWARKLRDAREREKEDKNGQV